MSAGTLYGEPLKALAAEPAFWPAAPTASARRDTPFCGDRVEIAVTMERGRILAMGHRTRGCLLCRAAAAALCANAVGTGSGDLAALLAQLRDYLGRGGVWPGEERWRVWEAFAPARDHPARRPCVTLALEAAVAAVGGDRPKAAAAVLAAGRSSRMGEGHKLALPWRGRTVLRHVVDNALSVPEVEQVIVVLGAHRDRLMREVEGSGATVVVNPEFELGMASSVRAAVAAVTPGLGGLLLCLGDMPAVTVEDMAAPVRAWSADPSRPIVRPVWRGKPGHPVLFDRALFGDLSVLTGDGGARAVVAADPSRVALVPASGEGVLIDIDTPESYAEAFFRFGDERNG